MWISRCFVNILTAAVVQAMISSMVKGITGRGVMKTGRGYYNNMDKNL